MKAGSSLEGRTGPVFRSDPQNDRAMKTGVERLEVETSRGEIPRLIPGSACGLLSHARTVRLTTQRTRTIFDRTERVVHRFRGSSRADGDIFWEPQGVYRAAEVYFGRRRRAAPGR